MNQSIHRKPAFTLVELLVVIAIIALLLAALLPAFAVVRNNARIAQTRAMFEALSAGIESYRAEQPLGASLPPSASDNTTNPSEISIPTGQGTSTTPVAGAHLLVGALIGFDGLGTPGFKDLDQDGKWSNNTHKGQTGGIFYVDPATGKEKYSRYGPYVDEKARERTATLKQLAEKGRLLNPDEAGNAGREGAPSLFIDSWDLPVLYYRASPASNRMVAVTTGQKVPGIYRQEDNGLITGTVGGTAIGSGKGLDFGAGADSDAGGDPTYHDIAKAKCPEMNVTVQNILEDDQNWQKTFVRYIIDPKIKARPTPVQKDSYLLISAGPDSRYGTPDDVTNWTRETN